MFQHRSSDEIAQLEESSARAVDKQIILAMRTLGLTSRRVAARLLAEHEAGVERFYPASFRPSQPEFWPLPLPLPTSEKVASTQTWKQVLAWGGIIAIGAPIALTMAAMVIVVFSLVIGINPR